MPDYIKWDLNILFSYQAVYILHYNLSTKCITKLDFFATATLFWSKWTMSFLRKHKNLQFHVLNTLKSNFDSDLQPWLDSCWPIICLWQPTLAQWPPLFFYPHAETVNSNQLPPPKSPDARLWSQASVRDWEGGGRSTLACQDSPETNEVCWAESSCSCCATAAATTHSLPRFHIHTNISALAVLINHQAGLSWPGRAHPVLKANQENYMQTPRDLFSLS